MKKHNKTNRKVVITVEIIKKAIKKRNKVNKILSFLTSSIVISTFRLVSIITIFNSSSFVVDFFSWIVDSLLSLFVFVDSLLSSFDFSLTFSPLAFFAQSKKKSKKLKNSKNVFKSQKLLFSTNSFFFLSSRDSTPSFVFTKSKRKIKKTKKWKQTFQKKFKRR